MGLLDDAIREHLELKRAHGADPTEVERQELEALGAPRQASSPARPARRKRAAEGTRPSRRTRRRAEPSRRPAEPEPEPEPEATPRTLVRRRA